MRNNKRKRRRTHSRSKTRSRPPPTRRRSDPSKDAEKQQAPRTGPVHSTTLKDLFLRRSSSGALLTRRGHERIEVLLGDAEPEDVLVPELDPLIVDLLEARVAGRRFCIELVG